MEMPVVVSLELPSKEDEDELIESENKQDDINPSKEGVINSVTVPPNPSPSKKDKNKLKKEKKRANAARLEMEEQHVATELTGWTLVTNEEENTTSKKALHVNKGANKQFLSENSEGDFQYITTKEQKQRSRKEKEHIAGIMEKLAKYKEEEDEEDTMIDMMSGLCQTKSKPAKKKSPKKDRKQKQKDSLSELYSDESSDMTRTSSRSSSQAAGSYSKLLKSVKGGGGAGRGYKSPGAEKQNNQKGKKTAKRKEESPQEQPASEMGEETEVRVTVHKAEVRFIYGPGANNLERIYQLTGVRIFVLPSDERDNYNAEVVLLGHKLQLGAALSMVFSQSYEYQRISREASRQELLQQQEPNQFHPLISGSMAAQKMSSAHQQQQAYSYNETAGYYDDDVDNAHPGGLEMYQGKGNSTRKAGNRKQNKGVKQVAANEDRSAQPRHFQSKSENKSPSKGQGQAQNKGQGKSEGQTPNKGQAQTPSKGQGQTPSKGQGQTPNKGQAQTPNKGQAQTPNKGQGQTPNKGQGQTPNKGQGHAHNYEGHRKNPKHEHTGHGGKQKKPLFEPYLTAEEISHGLKRGELIQGAVRINPKNFEEAYVPHPDGMSDIFLHGLSARNRALNGDIVVLQLNDRSEWLMDKKVLSQPKEDRDASRRETGDCPDVIIESEEVIETTPTADTADKKAAAERTKVEVTTIADGTGPVADDKSSASVDGGNTTQQVEKDMKSPNKGYKRYKEEKFVRIGDIKEDGDSLLWKDSGEPNRYVRRTAKVVGIVQRKNSRACTGHIKPMQRKDSYQALFVSSDYRMPRIIIPLEDCPEHFMERSDDFASTLFVARITDWKEWSLYANGRLARSLGEAGEIEPETEAHLIENDIDFSEFPPEALESLPQDLPWSIPPEELADRRDFRQECVFTIDSKTARDLDDALSVKSLGDGMYEVGVHIADVSYFVKEKTVLDEIAARRATSVYLVHRVIPMLPRLLCEKLCSLNPAEDRLTFSVVWKISETGEVEEEWFCRSVISSCVKLSYEHAQGFIEQPDREWTEEELPPLSGGFTVEDIKSRTLILDRIAKNLRKARSDSGALRLDQVKLQYSLSSETGLPNGYSVYQQKDSNKLVEEFMLLANMAVAHRIYSGYPNKALLLRHSPPQDKRIEDLHDRCSALGIHLDISSAGSLQRSLLEIAGEDDFSQARMQVLVAMLSKPMQPEKYFCTGCIDNESMYHHYALNVPLYTHFTSPIRRYADCIVHRLLGASLGYCEEPERSSEEINKQADHCNDKKYAAKVVGHKSSDLFFSIFVKTAGPLYEKAMVMQIQNRAFDVFVLKLGVTKRVYVDKLELKEKAFRCQKKVPSLTLVWKDEVTGSPGVKQEIQIFSIVDCILKAGDLPLQWMATIRCPTSTPASKADTLTVTDSQTVTENLADQAAAEGTTDSL